MAHIVRPTAEDTARAAAASVVLGDRQPSGRHLRVVAADAVDGDAVELPDAASDALAEVLVLLARGESVSIVGVESEITTQQAADLLNVSRPYVVELVERGEIAHRKVGPRRRLRLADVLAFKEIDDARRLAVADELTAEAQRLGLDY
ncbi:MAG: excisionase family DNA-binding protein [Acidimicrobiales bacterium]